MKKGCGTNIQKYDTRKNRSHAERYPPGTEVTLNSMEGESHMPPGLKGKVDMVDDAGQIHVNWENGSSLALVPGVDSFHITDLPRAERPKQQPSR